MLSATLKKTNPGKNRISKLFYKELNISPRMAPLDFVSEIRLPTDNQENVLPKIDLTLTPYIKAPVSLINNFNFEIVGCLGPIQSGKTLVSLIATGYRIANPSEAGPSLTIHPAQDDARSFMMDRIVPMISASPMMSEQVTLDKRDISQLGLKLRNMVIVPAWASAPRTIASYPYRYVHLSEVRLMPLTIGDESNAIKLMENRMSTFLSFGGGQAILDSSPNVEGDLLHHQLAVMGTIVLLWFVPCPTCGKYQQLDFDCKGNFNHNKIRETGNVICTCRFCGGEFQDANFKRSWNNKGIYATDGFPVPDDVDYVNNLICPGVNYKDFKRIFFWWTGEVNPFTSFSKLWDEYCKTKDSLVDYKNFVQCTRGKFWKDMSSVSSVEEFKKFKRDYTMGQVPDGVKVVLAGIDTQDNGFWFAVWGFSYMYSVFLIDEGFIPCDIGFTDARDIEDAFYKRLFNQTYQGTGEMWQIALAAIDSKGHRTKDIYDVCRKIPQLKAIGGVAKQSRPLMVSKQDTHFNVRTADYLDETERWVADNKLNLPGNVPDAFISQFCAQVKKQVINQKNGKQTYEWCRVGADHQRFASAYCQSLLDVNVTMNGQPVGYLRARLRDVNFKMNPHHNRPAMTAASGNSLKRKKIVNPYFDKNTSGFNW